MDNTERIDFFTKEASQQNHVHMIKNAYRYMYGFNKNQNDSRLYPKRDLLKESIETIYSLYNDTVYNTAKLMYFSLMKSPQYYKLSVLNEFDFNPEYDINDNLLLLNSFKIPNFLQARCIQIPKETNSNIMLESVMDDHALLTHPEIQQNEDAEIRLEHRGNNFSNITYYECMNPIFSDVNTEANRIEGYQIFNKLFNIDQTFNDLNTIDKTKSIGFFSFVRDNLFDSTKNDLYNDAIKKLYMKIAPYTLSSIKAFYINSPMANIFFMALSIMWIKKHYGDNEFIQFKNKTIEYLDYLLSTYDGSKFPDIDNSDQLFDAIGPTNDPKIISDDIYLVINALFDTTSGASIDRVGRDSTKYNKLAIKPDPAIAVSSLVELFYKFENVNWFDSSLFEVNITDDNIKSLELFSESIIEASLIYKNSLLMGSICNIKTTKDGKADFYSYEDSKACTWKLDKTCTIYKDFKMSRDTEDLNNISDFAAINCFTSLGFSIQICIDNYLSKNDMLLMNNQMPRSKTIIDIINYYIKDFLYQQDCISYENADSMNSVDNIKDAVRLLGAYDYGLMIKTWIYDSYYYWRSYKKIFKLINKKDQNEFYNMYTRYNNTQCPIFSEFNSFIIVPHVRGFSTLPMAGIYSYSCILGCLKWYTTNDDYILSSFSRILLKDLYIFGDQYNDDPNWYRIVKFSEDHFEYPFVIRTPLLQTALNSFHSWDIERILGNMYAHWYTDLILPIFSQNPTLKQSISNNIAMYEFDTTLLDKFKLPYMYNQQFGTHVIWNMLAGTTNLNSCILNIYSNIVSCAMYMMLKDAIDNNKQKFNFYQYHPNKSNNNSYNILGNILYIRNKISDDQLFYGKISNVLITNCYEKINSGIDEVYYNCNGLPVYLFYENGISIIFENIYSVENELSLKHPEMTTTDICIDITNITNSYIKVINDNIATNNQNDMDRFTIINIIANQLEQLNICNQYSIDDYNSINDFIEKSNVGEIYSNFQSRFSNCECYIPAIVYITLYNLDADQYRKYITSRINDFNKFITIRDKIINIGNTTKPNAFTEKVTYDNTNDIVENTNIDEITLVQTVKDIIDFNGTQYNKKALSDLKIYHPKWLTYSLKKLNSIKTNTTAGNNLRDSMKCLISYLAKDNHRFLFEELKK